MNNPPAYCAVITTCANSEDAEKIARALLAEKLAACIQVFPIKSFYTWKGSVNADNECLLLIKAKAVAYPQIETCIRKNHTYEVPEIIQLPIVTGLTAYLNWIEEVTQ